MRWIKTVQNGCYILLASSPFPFRARFEAVAVEYSNHFPHTQQFLSNAKLTLVINGRVFGFGSLDDALRTVA